MQCCTADFLIPLLTTLIKTVVTVQSEQLFSQKGIARDIRIISSVTEIYSLGGSFGEWTGSKPPIWQQHISTRCPTCKSQGQRQCSVTFPPPGWCFMLSVEPILDLTFFRSGMGAAASGAREVLSEPGDLGEERTTATFLTLLTSALAESAWLEGDFGVPGLLCPLWASGWRGGRSEGLEEDSNHGQKELKGIKKDTASSVKSWPSVIRSGSNCGSVALHQFNVTPTDSCSSSFYFYLYHFLEREVSWH